MSFSRGQVDWPGCCLSNSLDSTDGLWAAMGKAPSFPLGSAWGRRGHVTKKMLQPTHALTVGLHFFSEIMPSPRLHLCPPRPREETWLFWLSHCSQDRALGGGQLERVPITCTLATRLHWAQDTAPGDWELPELSRV